MCSRHFRWREEQEQRSGKESMEVILRGLPGIHEVGMLDRKLGTSWM